MADDDQDIPHITVHPAGRSQTQPKDMNTAPEAPAGNPYAKYVKPKVSADNPYAKYLPDNKVAKPAEEPIDTTSGASSMWAKYTLAAADNPAEAKASLEMSYGPDNVREYAAPGAEKTWQVKEKGKWTSVFPDSLRGSFEHIAYDMTAFAPELAGGAIAGGIGAKYGMLAGGKIGGITGGLGGVAFGTAAGKYVDDLRKAALKIYAKTPREQLEKMGSDAIWMAAFDTLGPSAKAALKNTGAFARLHLAEVTPEIEKAAGKAFQTGGAPTTNAAPGMKISQAHENFFQQLGIRSKYVKNLEATTRLFVDKLRKAGVENPKEVLEHMKGGNMPLPSELNVKAQKALEEVKADIDKAQEAAAKTAEKIQQAAVKAVDSAYQTARTATQGHVDAELASIIALLRSQKAPVI